MRARYNWLIAFVAAALLSLIVARGTLAQCGTVHVVRPGETLVSIARLYDIPPQAIVEANALRNPSLIHVGQRLTIPCPGLVGKTTHIVSPGETLSGIARRYGVDPRQLAAYNNLRDPGRLLPGQLLYIPRPVPVSTPTPAVITPEPIPVVVKPVATPLPTPVPTLIPPPTPTVIPPPSPCQCEQIVIHQPTQGMTITSPVLVTGLASGFEQTVVVAVLDGSGGQIGLEPATIVGEYGQQGTFTASVPFEVPVNSQPGRVQVWSESPRDGAIEHLSSVTVMVQGLELDPLLERLERAIATRDSEGLLALMSNPFHIGLVGAEAADLVPARAIAQLWASYLEPGKPYLEYGVDARALLGEQADLGPDIVHIVYSPGWGAEGQFNAFLLISNVRGQARWAGILFKPRAALP